MKEQKWIAEVLLEDSGELPARRKRALEEALRRDPELRAFQQRLRQTRGMLRTGEENFEVSAFTMERIKAEAVRHTARTKPGRRFAERPGAFATWRPAAIYATLSVALFAFGTFLILQFGPPVTAPPYAEAPTPEAELHPLALAEWQLPFEAAYAELEDALDRLYTQLDEWVWLTDDDYEDDWARELLYLEESS
jgi:anti-sigma-K factor RskA